MQIGSQNYQAPFRSNGPQAFDMELARKLLHVALEKGGEYADVFLEYRAGGSLVLDEGIIKSASRGVSIGVGIRVMRKDATGYAYVESLDFADMEKAARTAAQIARESPQTPANFVTRSVPSRYHVKPITLDVDGAFKRSLLTRADEAARKAHVENGEIVRVEASLSEEVREILVASSDGRFAEDIQPLFRFSIRVVAQRDGRRQEGGSGGGGRKSFDYFLEHSPESHALEAVRQAFVMLDAKDAPAGKLTVVLAPGDSGILLHEAVGHGLEADFNRKGTSNYSGQIGKKVASELCTVVDDPTLHFARGAINVDDEGNDPIRSVLIENGVLLGYMHDAHSARHYKLNTTGNGRRESFACAPLPRMTNTVLLSGPHDPEEILKSVKRGVFARKFGGGQVDISNGDFVFSLTESYLIEDGKLSYPLKGVNLIGNGPDVLQRVSMLGNDSSLSDGIWTCGKDGQSVPVGVGCPTVLIDEITVGGTKIE